VDGTVSQEEVVAELMQLEAEVFLQEEMLQGEVVDQVYQEVILQEEAEAELMEVAPQGMEDLVVAELVAVLQRELQEQLILEAEAEVDQTFRLQIEVVEQEGLVLLLSDININNYGSFCKTIGR
jgi:hypothetical protein